MRCDVGFIVSSQEDGIGGTPCNTSGITFIGGDQTFFGIVAIFYAGRIGNCSCDRSYDSACIGSICQNGCFIVTVAYDRSVPGLSSDSSCIGG